MSPGTALANLVWAAASLPAHARLRRGLTEPAEAQREVLRRLLARNAGSAYGRAHGFDEILTYADFAARVPLATYEDLEPWIARIRRGETRVLTCDPVRRLVPTSGSAGARKLIPFTAQLQREFNGAIGAWMVDLFRHDPALLGGAAYWSISPLAAESSETASAVPIGFEDDSAYLGGVRQRLVNSIMAVPSSVRRLTDIAAFRRATLVALLRRPDLRLISVWHPSFLALLLDELVSSWEELLRVAGQSRLRRADPQNPLSIWPALRLVSCWTDGHAGLAAHDLARRLPGVRMQPKGLLATEAIITLPFRGGHPLAITSHFFEFLAADGRLFLARQLRAGETYEVVVTTGGGLWRYRLGDRVVVDGFVERTPSLRFAGRVAGISDRRGEKLSEGFVAGVLRDLLADRPPPSFALLAPEDDPSGPCAYVLFVEGVVQADDATKLDHALRANPHYAWCRDLGQLGAPRVMAIRRGGYETYVRRAIERGQRVGDVKPVALATESGWSARFYPAASPNQCHPVVDIDSARDDRAAVAG